MRARGVRARARAQEELQGYSDFDMNSTAFGVIWGHFSRCSQRSPTQRARALVSANAYWMLIGARNPWVCPGHLFRLGLQAGVLIHCPGEWAFPGQDKVPLAAHRPPPSPAPPPVCQLLRRTSGTLVPIITPSFPDHSPTFLSLPSSPPPPQAQAEVRQPRQSGVGGRILPGYHLKS